MAAYSRKDEGGRAVPDESEYFEALVGALHRQSFDWVIAQAQEEIAEGRAVTKEVRAPDITQVIADDSFVRQTPRRRRAALIATEPLNDVERLEVLLRAIKAAVIDRAALEEAIMDSVDNMQVAFLPERSGDGSASDGQRASHKLDRDQAMRGISVGDKLAGSLSALREVTDVGSR